jgi:preprotein translocase subunit SecA
VTASIASVGVVRGAYAERQEERLSKVDQLGKQIAGRIARTHRSRRRGWRRFPDLVERCGSAVAALSDAELERAAMGLRPELDLNGFADEIVAKAFALVREAATRTLGQRHYPAQLRGGWVMLHGMVAEMETGEGKTLTATLPACAAALAGIPVHIVTVNDYLATRDSEAMRPLYERLGLTVGTVISEMDPGERRAAYTCDVTYCTNKQVVFDYLWDRITLEGRPSRLRLKLDKLNQASSARDALIHRGLRFAIVDEADSVLVDEARTPLIISERSHDQLEESLYRNAVGLARELTRDEHFSLDERNSHTEILAAGETLLESLAEPLGGIWVAQMRREALVAQALVALHCYQRDQHYLVSDDKVTIIDEYTGRVMADRSWEHGLHQMIEVKEGVPLTGRQDPRARISYQRFFRRYLLLAGMTGTAKEVTRELGSVYGLPVVCIPPERPLQRRFLGETVLATAEQKWQRVVESVARIRDEGRSVLVGTRSVEASEHLSALLDEAQLPHRVLNARQDREEAEVVAMAGGAQRITVATNMAGRGTDIQLSDELRERGGLHVIGTERHEARRIDRQLFGRCGRQGDPGSTESIVSLEDSLFDTYGDELSRRIARAALEHGGDISSRALSFALDRCQRTAEGLHHRARRDLLERDTRLETMLAFSGRRDQ